MDQVTKDLFKTNAVRVAPADCPFWYTSGKLGPFYINTHFLIKDEAEANETLKIIEQAISDDKKTAPKVIFNHLMKLYESSGTYKNVIDEITSKARNYNFDFISGGERRDFFFSMIPAHLLGKNHLTIYKDLSSCITDSNFEPVDYDFNGKTALHIADLITEASSYERAWVPAIRDLGADIKNTIAVVDRHQNGRTVLEGLGVSMDTITGIDKNLFDEAKAEGIIDEVQYELVLKFLDDPDKYMKDFIVSHPSFINEQIALGGKARERAELAKSKGYV